mmetsp:Transcript_6057/g.11045  ORF Transcript_6057/g.11045 Transcript_6057/m.11045 type:complete len:86 (+) Transcript_6057:1369-1626(+)
MSVKPSLERVIRTSQSSLAIWESRPEVGSSRKRTGGREMRASPTLTRFCWPPEIPRRSESPILVLRQPSSFSFSIRSFTRCCLSL